MKDVLDSIIVVVNWREVYFKFPENAMFCTGDLKNGVLLDD